MSLSNNFPTIKPTLLLDFANTKQLDPRITFTRASTATYYDGKTVAMAEQNLAPRSQELDNTSVWSTQAVTVTANTSVAPDGTTTADTITASATSATHFLFFGAYPTVSIGIQLGCSVFAKAGTNNFFQLSVLNEANTFANFDLSTGTIGSTGSNVSSVTMTSVGSGWYRCSFVITSTTNAANSALAFAPVASNTVGRLPTWTPAGTETILLWGAQVEQRSAVTAYTATTTAAITNYIPVLMTAASGVARFDNNPTTDESLGLLIEESRTNLLTYSAALDTWTVTRTTVSANSNVAPDGTLSADRLVEDTTASASHLIFGPSPGTLGAGTYTFSVYAKASGRTQLRIAQTLTTAYSLDFDLTALTTSGAVGGATGTITAVGNGWYRCTMTFTTVASIAQSFVLYLMSGGSTTYTGDGWSGMFLWGAQAEAGAFPTSYIPTTTATVTRAADAASMTGTNLTNWYTADQGTLYADFLFNQASGPSSYVAAFSQGATTSDSILLYAQQSASRFRGDVYVGSNAQAAFTYTTAGAPAANTPYKAVLAYKVNDFAMSVSAGTVLTDTLGTLPTSDRFNIGVSPLASLYLNGTIKKIAFYPQRLTNIQLVALTS